jgi:hypothetical protein
LFISLGELTRAEQSDKQLHLLAFHALLMVMSSRKKKERETKTRQDKTRGMQEM